MSTAVAEHVRPLPAAGQFAADYGIVNRNNFNRTTQAAYGVVDHTYVAIAYVMLPEISRGDMLVIVPRGERQRRAAGFYELQAFGQPLNQAARAVIPQAVIDSSWFMWVTRSALSTPGITDEVAYGMLPQCLLRVQSSYPSTYLPGAYRGGGPYEMTVVPGINSTNQAWLAILPGDDGADHGWVVGPESTRRERVDMVDTHGLTPYMGQFRCWWLPRTGVVPVTAEGLTNIRWYSPTVVTRLRVNRRDMPTMFRTPDADAQMEVAAVALSGNPYTYLLVLPPSTNTTSREVGWTAEGEYGLRHSTPGLARAIGIEPGEHRYWHMTPDMEFTVVEEGVPFFEYGISNVVFDDLLDEAEPTPVEDKASPDEPSVAELQARLAVLRADAEVLREAIHSEANDRGWSEEYGDFMSNVNQRTSVVKLDPLTVETRVTVSGTFEIPFSYTATITHTGDLDDSDIALDMDRAVASMRSNDVPRPEWEWTED